MWIFARRRFKMKKCYFIYHRPVAEGGRVVVLFDEPRTDAGFWLLGGLLQKYNLNYLYARDHLIFGYLSDL